MNHPPAAATPKLPRSTVISLFGVVNFSLHCQSFSICVRISDFSPANFHASKPRDYTILLRISLTPDYRTDFHCELLHKRTPQSYRKLFDVISKRKYGGPPSLPHTGSDINDDSKKSNLDSAQSSTYETNAPPHSSAANPSIHSSRKRTNEPSVPPPFAPRNTISIPCAAAHNPPYQPNTTNSTIPGGNHCEYPFAKGWHETNRTNGNQTNQPPTPIPTHPTTTQRGAEQRRTLFVNSRKHAVLLPSSRAAHCIQWPTVCSASRWKRSLCLC